MRQNAGFTNWTFDRVDQELRSIMDAIYHAVAYTAVQYGNPQDYVLGANIAGFQKVARAMMAQGLVWGASLFLCRVYSCYPEDKGGCLNETKHQTHFHWAFGPVCCRRPFGNRAGGAACLSFLSRLPAAALQDRVFRYVDIEALVKARREATQPADTREVLRKPPLQNRGRPMCWP